jgi:hypothetical protein
MICAITRDRKLCSSTFDFITEENKQLRVDYTPISDFSRTLFFKTSDS